MYKMFSKKWFFLKINQICAFKRVFEPLEEPILIILKYKKIKRGQLEVWPLNMNQQRSLLKFAKKL